MNLCWPRMAIRPAAVAIIVLRHLEFRLTERALHGDRRNILGAAGPRVPRPRRDAHTTQTPRHGGPGAIYELSDLAQRPTLQIEARGFTEIHFFQHSIGRELILPALNTLARAHAVPPLL